MEENAELRRRLDLQLRQEEADLETLSFEAIDDGDGAQSKASQESRIAMNSPGHLLICNREHVTSDYNPSENILSPLLNQKKMSLLHPIKL